MLMNRHQFNERDDDMTLKAVILGVAGAMALMTATPAAAVMISFGGVDPGDGSQLTSALTPDNSNDLARGLFVETFDTENGGCGLNSTAFGVQISGDYVIRKGSVATAAAPGHESTCFAAGPALLGGASDSATIDFTSALSSNPLFAGKKIDYLGLYWGSMDDYNSITFYAGDDALLTLTGADVRAAAAVSGDQVAAGANRYVNLYFDVHEQFTRLVFSATSYAFELDNVAVRVADVPEPATLGLMGMGALGLAAAGRRRRKV